MAAPPPSSSAFPESLQQRDLLRCGLEGPRNVANFGYAGSFASLGVDESFSLDAFKALCKIKILEYSDELIIFELVGVDVSIANALRRILIAEVPTVAIESIHMYQNTGVIQDEVLAHRLGLVPMRIRPSMVEWRKENEELSEDNCLKFKFHVKCTESDIKSNLNHMPIYTSHFEWIPMSKKQHDAFSSDPPRPVIENILLTKLRPGQEIEAELYCEKGIGKTHAKWSPVATAVYRLQPQFSFPKGLMRGEEAEELKKLCPMGVFDIEEGVVIAKNPRHCTTCRACLERFPGQVALSKVRNHFIFSVESTGSVPAPKLLEEAIGVLREKAVRLRDNLQTTVSSMDLH